MRSRPQTASGGDHGVGTRAMLLVETGQPGEWRWRMNHGAMLAAIVGLLCVGVGAQVRSQSSKCGAIVGESGLDAALLEQFCRRAVPTDAVEGLQASGSLLWVMVTRDLASAMQIDTLKAEALVQRWMGIWKSYTGSQAVTVYVMWAGIEVARGDVTLLGRDRITIRRP